MPTYVYETIPSTGQDAVERFELRQSMDAAPLARHPGDGRPVRRVISGGMGLVPAPDPNAVRTEPGSGCGPGTCGCGRFS